MSAFQTWADHRVRPIEDRTFIGARRRVTSPWTANWGSTTSLLGTELRAIGARDVVLQIDIEERHLRVDGGLRADARPATHAVVLSFDSRHGPLRYAADLYNDRPYGREVMQQLWKHNLRAIGMTLQALRAITRHGVLASGEQYTGNLAIESGDSSTSRQQAIELVAKTAGVAWAPGMLLSDRIIRRAKANAHPDANGNSDAPWHELMHALKILGLS